MAKLDIKVVAKSRIQIRGQMEAVGVYFKYFVEMSSNNAFVFYLEWIPQKILYVIF